MVAMVGDHTSQTCALPPHTDELYWVELCDPALQWPAQSGRHPSLLSAALLRL